MSHKKEEKAAMRDKGQGMQPNRVMAVFHEAALAFNLPREATLGDLVEELDALGTIYGGMPLYVDVRLPN
jgi:hypothetical protein